MGAVYLLNVTRWQSEAARMVSLLPIGVTFVTGPFGTHLYRLQTAKLVAATAGMDKPAALETLRTRGGVSQPALYGVDRRGRAAGARSAAPQQRGVRQRSIRSHPAWTRSTRSAPIPTPPQGDKPVDDRGTAAAGI